MKKATALFLVFALIFSFGGCRTSNENDSSSSLSSASSSESEIASSSELISSSSSRSEITSSIEAKNSAASSKNQISSNASAISLKTFYKDIGGSGGDYFQSVKQTLDGGCIVVGQSSSKDGDFSGLNKGDSDAIIVKFDINGNIQWIKNIGGSSYDSFSSVVLTSDGGYIAVGCSQSNDGDFSGLNKGYLDAIAVKFDGNGNKQWVKDLGGNNEDIFFSVVQTSDGGFVAVGRNSSKNGDFVGLNKGSRDAIIVKFDGNGNIQWLNDFGGTEDETFFSVNLSKDDGYIAVGSSTSNDDIFSGLNKGDGDAIIVKMDRVGNVQWLNDIGGTGSDELDGIVQTSDGGYIASGYSFSKDGDFSGPKDGIQAIIVKCDNSGCKQWVKCINSGDRFYSISQTLDGNYIAESCKSFFEFDNNGNIQWEKSMGGTNKHDIFYSGIQTSDGGFIAVGFNDDAGLNKVNDAILIKLDSNCNMQ